MSDDIESFKDYWQHVQRNALIELEETEEWEEREDAEMGEEERISCAAEYAAENDQLTIYSPRTVIYHTDQGFEGEGHDRFVAHHEFRENDATTMLHGLARAAYFNDVRNVLENVYSFRDDLGECTALIDSTIWSEGVEFEYEYIRNTMDGDVAYTFTLEHLGSCEWRMRDPNGLSFEVISPKIRVTQSDSLIEEKSLKVWLDNICARRLRELDDYSQPYDN